MRSGSPGWAAGPQYVRPLGAKPHVSSAVMWSVVSSSAALCANTCTQRHSKSFLRRHPRKLSSLEIVLLELLKALVHEMVMNPAAGADD